MSRSLKANIIGNVCTGFINRIVHERKRKKQLKVMPLDNTENRIYMYILFYVFMV